MVRTTAALGVLLLAVSSGAIAQTDGGKLVESKCSACHERTDGGLERIKDSRRTPEGWDMTLVRMMLVHGVEMSGAERAAMVKHLADTRGLAPEETAPYRYVLERRSNLVEDQPDEQIAVMCARCHSYARTALQRRTQDDWLKHAHWHLGQWPTIEYQALGRDRNWWEIASTEMPERLASTFPLETETWSKWKGYDSPDLSGEWKVVGHTPGRGDYHGLMTVSREGADHYTVQIDIVGADGNSTAGAGRAILYTGYEWRASLDFGGEEGLQVLAYDAPSNTLNGRWFLADNDVIGGDLTAAREDGKARILALQPTYLKAGETTRLTIHGTNLAGSIDLGSDIEILETEAGSLSPTSIVVRVEAAGGAAPGLRAVKVGDAQADGRLVVYDKFESVRVEPESAIARVGGDGPLPPVPAQFDAVAYLNGADGQSGTEDDVRIGVVPAAWSVVDNTELAAELEDTKFAGSMDPALGLFTPAGAGPNPARPFSTNNAGDLRVIATVKDGDRELEGSAHLVVTVQRWNDPPIR